MSAHHIEHGNSFKLYSRLFQYTWHYWPAFLIAMLANITYSGVNSGFTYLLKPILDKGFIARDVHFIHFLPFLILGAFLIQGLTDIAGSYFMGVVARSVIMDFRQSIFNHLLRLPAKYFDNTSTGQVLSTMIYNVEQVASAGSDSLTTLVQSFCLIVGLLVVMFSISWQLSLLFLIIAPLISFAVHFTNRRLRRISMQLQNQMGTVTSIAEEAVEGYKVIRGFGGQTYEKNKFNKATDTNRRKELKVIVIKALSISSVQLIAGVALSLIIFLVTSKHSGMQLSAGSFAALVSAMCMLLKPLKNFTTVNTGIQRGLAGAQSVFNVLDMDIEHDEGTQSIKVAQGHIRFDHVFFRYSNIEKQVLKDVSFTVKPGQIVALVGRSGSGKTTIVNLLQRFYEGFSGQITLDDIDINQFILADLRQQFATVSQHVTLFNDTVAHNIAYGRFAETSEEDIIAAAKAAHAWEFIQQMPEGLKTLVGENGVLLSGGQRQRIAIARAILKKAPILILDEATSALDTEAEKLIQAALESLMKHCTTLVIAHRLSTIENANLIVVLDDGRIVEIGTHTELLAQNGHYAKLYRMQFAFEKLDA